MLEVLSHSWPIVLGMAALLGGSAFFSASETAVFNLGPSDLRQAGSPLRTTLERLMKDRSSVLVTILLGNLLVNVLYFNLGSLLAGRLAGAGATEAAALTPFVVLATLVITSELVPKIVAVQWPLRVSRVIALPLLVAGRILHVPRVLLAGIADLLTRLLAGSRREEGDLTTEELASLLEAAAAGGHLGPDEYEWLQSVIFLSQTEVREVMTPRVALIALARTGTRAELLDLVARHRRNKVLVYEESLDRIEGYVDVKELLASEDESIERFIRPIVFVPETAPVAGVMERFASEGLRLMIAVDEYGGTAGLVTHEDIVEAVIGDLSDESDSPVPPLIRLGEGRFNVDAGMGIRELARLVGPQRPKAPASTVGGLVTAMLGQIPRAGDTVRLGQLVLEVVSVRGRRPARIEMRLEPPPGAS